ERAGKVDTLSGTRGTVSVIGAVSPPGGDFSEPVTQHTSRFIRCFWALDRDLANARHYPAIGWLSSYSEYLPDTAFWWEKMDPNWQENRDYLMNLLQEEVALQRIAKLVGPDALPENQRLTLFLAEIIKNAFLQQNSFDEIDMYCAPGKQLWMLRVLVTFSKRSYALIKQGATLADITSISLLDRMNRMKSEIKNEDKQAMAELEQKIIEELEMLERKIKA
ncbi:MAG: V-type ATP synthase subunit A, partial [Lentisphaeria bacterium]